MRVYHNEWPGVECGCRFGRGCGCTCVCKHVVLTNCSQGKDEDTMSNVP